MSYAGFWKRFAAAWLLVLPLVLISSLESAGATKLGVSYARVMKYIGAFFEMEEKPPVSGEIRYMGLAKNGLACLTTFGNKDNLTAASLTFSLLEGYPNTVQENKMIAFRFLRSVAPRWKGHINWFADTLNEFKNGVSTQKKIILDDKIVIQMSCIVDSEMIAITARGKREEDK